MTREYRLMTFVLIMGAMSTGLLLLGRLTDAMRDSIFWYYGVSFTDLRPVHDIGYLSLTVGQIVVASLALVGFVAFVAAERLRLTRLRRQRHQCTEQRAHQRVERLTRHEWLTECSRRAVGFTLAMVLLFCAQVFFERSLIGDGMAWQYATWSSVPPLATLLALCCVVGSFVAAISMYGLHVIFVLGHLFASLRRRHAAVRVAVRVGATAVRHTLRELFGDNQLSRPPPRVRVRVEVTLPVGPDRIQA